MAATMTRADWVAFQRVMRERLRICRQEVVGDD
jgi:hypothetical protein